MGKVVRLASAIVLVLGLAMAVVACGSASPTPTAAPPKAAPSPAAAAPTAAQPAVVATKAEAAPAKPAIQWVGDKLQPMADGFPNKTITLYSGFQPGHQSDIYLRLLAEVAKRHSPVPVIADNRVAGPRLYWDLIDFWGTQPGGTEGYALGEVSFKAAALRSVTVDIGNYTHKDVNPVIMTGFTNHAFGVRANDSRFKTIQDVVQWAKANPKKLKIGSSSVGSATHLGSQMLGKSAGFDFTFVPHTGGAQAVLTLMGEGVDVAVTTLGGFAGKPELRVVLLTGDRRPETAPGVPLASDLGYNIPFFNEQGLFTHPKVSPARVAWLHELLKKVAESPEYAKLLNDLGSSRLVVGPEELQKKGDEFAQVVEPLVKELGLHKSQVTKK